MMSTQNLCVRLQSQQPEPYNAPYRESPGAYINHPHSSPQQPVQHQQSYMPAPQQAQPTYMNAAPARHHEYGLAPGANDSQGSGLGVSSPGPWQVHYTPEGRPYYPQSVHGRHSVGRPCGLCLMQGGAGIAGSMIRRPVCYRICSPLQTAAGYVPLLSLEALSSGLLVALTCLGV